MDDPGRTLETAKLRGAIPIGHARVDGRTFDVAVAQVVLHELEGRAGIEEVRRDRMSQTMTAVPTRQPSSIAVTREQLLNPSFAERVATASREQGSRYRATCGEVPFQEPARARKQWALRPHTALHSFHDDPFANEINVVPFQERHLAHAEAVVVNDPEQRRVAR
jgi:hypothetical protein